MSISSIIQILVQIPKIVSLVLAISRAIEELKIRAKESALADAVARVGSAQSKQEAEGANKDIADHIP